MHLHISTCLLLPFVALGGFSMSGECILHLQIADQFGYSCWLVAFYDFLRLKKVLEVGKGARRFGK